MGIIDARGASLIYTSFDKDVLNTKISLPHGEFTWQMIQEIELIRSKLAIALEMARTKYKLQSKSLWVRICESIARILLKVPTPFVKIAESLSSPHSGK